MQQPISIFALFGGCRPMARECNEPVSNVYAWEREGRIPAAKQPRILSAGIALGLPITPELVIYPSGDVPEAVIVAARAHRPRIAPRTTASAADVHSLKAGTDRKYGNRRGVLPISEHSVAA